MATRTARVMVAQTPVTATLAPMPTATLAPMPTATLAPMRYGMAARTPEGLGVGMARHAATLRAAGTVAQIATLQTQLVALQAQLPVAPVTPAPSKTRRTSDRKFPNLAKSGSDDYVLIVHEIRMSPGFKS